MTPDDFKQAANVSSELVDRWYLPLMEVNRKFDLNSVYRMAYFLAQVGHESGGFRHVLELWGPTEAQKKYEGRKDLGNTQPGDGFKYRGRGLIQVTGRFNYEKMSNLMNLPLVEKPELLELPLHAAMSAGHFWKSIDGNGFVSRGDFIGLTRKINGGLNGLADRQTRLDRAIRALMASDGFDQC